MPIAFRCQQCGESFNGADALAGKKIKCRKCSAVVTVPIPQATKPAAKPPRPAPPAAPAFDPLQSPLSPPPLAAAPLLAGSLYSHPGGQALKKKVQQVAVRRGGPGAIQFTIMIGGTVLAVVLFAGAYGVFSRMTAHLRPVAAPKTGAEAAGGLRQMKIGPSGPAIDPLDEDAADAELEMDDQGDSLE